MIAPATGVVAALSSTSALDVSPALMTIIGLVAAETAHGTRMAIRPFSTIGTAGAGNPVLSLIEDVASIGLSSSRSAAGARRADRGRDVRGRVDGDPPAAAAAARPRAPVPRRA